jgi:hypothetical protein
VLRVKTHAEVKSDFLIARRPGSLQPPGFFVQRAARHAVIASRGFNSGRSTNLGESSWYDCLQSGLL